MGLISNIINITWSLLQLWERILPILNLRRFGGVLLSFNRKNWKRKQKYQSKREVIVEKSSHLTTMSPHLWVWMKIVIERRLLSIILHGRPVLFSSVWNPDRCLTGFCQSGWVGQIYQKLYNRTLRKIVCEFLGFVCRDAHQSVLSRNICSFTFFVYWPKFRILWVFFLNIWKNIFAIVKL